MSRAKVYLVGAGPGDVELITLKGYRLISQADVILYDHLVPSELLTLAKPTAEVMSVGKSAGRHTLAQREINVLLVEKAKTNEVVVRLKGGDPFLFGRGAEEAEACAKAAIDFEVVPGVTSAIAAPSYAGMVQEETQHPCLCRTGTMGLLFLILLLVFSFSSLRPQAIP